MSANFQCRKETMSCTMMECTPFISPGEDNHTSQRIRARTRVAKRSIGGNTTGTFRQEDLLLPLILQIQFLKVLWFLIKICLVVSVSDIRRSRPNSAAQRCPKSWRQPSHGRSGIFGHEVKRCRKLQKEVDEPIAVIAWAAKRSEMRDWTWHRSLAKFSTQHHA